MIASRASRRILPCCVLIFAGACSSSSARKHPEMIAEKYPEKNREEHHGAVKRPEAPPEDYRDLRHELEKRLARLPEAQRHMVLERLQRVPDEKRPEAMKRVIEHLDKTAAERGPAAPGPHPPDADLRAQIQEMRREIGRLHEELERLRSGPRGFAGGPPGPPREPAWRGEREGRGPGEPWLRRAPAPPPGRDREAERSRRGDREERPDGERWGPQEGRGWVPDGWMRRREGPAFDRDRGPDRREHRDVQRRPPSERDRGDMPRRGRGEEMKKREGEDRDRQGDERERPRGGERRERMENRERGRGEPDRRKDEERRRDRPSRERRDEDQDEE